MVGRTKHMGHLMVTGNPKVITRATLITLNSQPSTAYDRCIMFHCLIQNSSSIACSFTIIAAPIESRRFIDKNHSSAAPSAPLRTPPHPSPRAPLRIVKETKAR
ncbi:jg6229 [Pararge aegeria aegeria]|uniref:Jg6229 protein n=1 Tax=Pararge aegeria aegeria TaxID=348720 RepID=A0A8S4RAH8_9NEOP|nr:jg6229 [Pararge aegeria aegeria]